jgi:hypothetical protein
VCVRWYVIALIAASPPFLCVGVIDIHGSTTCQWYHALASWNPVRVLLSGVQLSVVEWLPPFRFQTWNVSQGVAGMGPGVGGQLNFSATALKNSQPAALMGAVAVTTT